MNRALAVGTLLALVGCGSSPQTITAEEARTALPTSAQTEVGAPSAGAAAAPNALVALQAAQPVTAEYAADTIALATVVNGGVAWALGVVSFVASLPPTTCAGDTCTWGPGSSALELNDWQLTVAKRGANDYVWALQGRSKTSPSASWIAFLSGEAFTTGVRHVGHGTLLVDFDAAAGLPRKTTDPAPQTGKIVGTYDNTAGGHVALQFLGTQDDANPLQKVNVAYQFSATSAGGDLQVATRNLTTFASLQLHSRWIETGAGRGDASYSAGGQTITRSQCWDAASTLLNLLYQSTGSTVDVGTESACAFGSAAAPTITAPE
jgi:hypothetical protein